jgi:hypothetical protein
VSRRPGPRNNRGRIATVSGVIAPDPPAPVIEGFPTGFTYVSSSPDNLASSQGVAFNHGVTRFWATGGPTGLAKSIYEYDSSYNQVAASVDFGVAQGLPSGTTQVNGITYWEGKLYAGYNNYSTTPEAGGVIVVDPASLSTIEAVHPATNGHTEGCCIRNTARGVEAFVFSHTSGLVERYDLATWTLQGSHQFGNWSVATAATYYQGGGWYGDCLCLGLHGSQSRPAAIDVCEWDDTALEFTPVYRMDRPTVWSGQGFNFASETLAFFAEREASAPDIYRIVRASVSKLDTLPHQTTNPASSQLTDLQYWYQRLTWNAAGPSWQLVDTQGNGATATVDATRVYPVPSSDGVKMRFAGDGASSIGLGNLFGASGWTVATIWFRGLVIRSTGTNEILFSWDASGSNVGDGRIEVSRTNARSIALFYNNNVNTLVTAGAMYTVGVPFDLCVKLTASGARIFVNGTQVATNATPGQLGGANQNCFLGSNFLASGGPKFECWDVRLYNADKDPTVLATYDMWTD